MADQEREIRDLRELVARLTERVYRLEQALGTEPAHTVQPPPAMPEMACHVEIPPAEPVEDRPRTVAPSTPLQISPRSPRDQGTPEISLESRIGSQWFNRVGIVAVLFGVAYFLKYAFENNWIGPSVRVLIGIVLGLGLMLWSERFRSRGYLAFSLGLKAVGIGALYLSLWAAFQLYHLVPASVAFVGMAIVTAVTAGLSIVEDAEVLAGLALVGGFITPLLLSTGQNREVSLFCYVLLLDLATLLLLFYRPWRRILGGSFIGTIVLYVGWYSTFYSANDLAVTLTFATIFFVIFSAGVLVATRVPVPDFEHASRTPLFVSFMNAAAYFLETYVMLADRNRAGNTSLALALAAAYAGMSLYLKRRGGDTDAQSQILAALHLALAVAFLTASVPLGLDGHWITIGWLVEAVALLTLAYRADSALVKALGVAVLVMAIVKLILVDEFSATTLLINARFGVYLLAIAALAWTVSLSRGLTAEPERTGRSVAIVAINVLALLALSLEVHDHYEQQMKDFVNRQVNVARATGAGRAAASVAQAARNSSEYRTMETARDFTYSAVWMIYGAALMWVGFARRSSFLRWQAMALIAVTVAKVFVFDTSHLERIYRITSFIALGVLLLAISFAYQRDWLKLSRAERESRA